MAVADRYDGFLIDLDGVVWLGREPIEGAAASLAALLAAGKELVFVTNNPTHSPASYAERLAGMGVEVAPERIVTAGVVVARLAAEAAGSEGVFVIGAEPLKEMVAAAGAACLQGEEAGAARVVVVSGHRGFDYGELLSAKRALDGGAALLATSRDPTMPMPGGAWPGTGAVLAAVETASGRRAEIAGKPERHLFELALAAIGRNSSTPPARGSFFAQRAKKEPRDGDGLRVAMVGDRVSSDIQGGRAAGLETVLVLSGASDREDAERADPAPDHVLDSLAGLVG